MFMHKDTTDLGSKITRDEHFTYGIYTLISNNRISSLSVVNIAFLEDMEGRPDPFWTEFGQTFSTRAGTPGFIEAVLNGEGNLSYVNNVEARYNSFGFAMAAAEDGVPYEDYQQMASQEHFVDVAGNPVELEIYSEDDYRRIVEIAKMN